YRHLNLAGAAVELGDAGVHLLADRKAFGPLFAAIAPPICALYESGEVGAREFRPQAAFPDLRDPARDARAPLDVAGAFGRERIAFELLDAERNALFLDIDVKHLGANLVALLVFLDDLFAGPLPIEVGKMDHAVHVAVEAEEEAELRLVLDLAF